MDQCLVVEEQELKERIVEVCLIKFHAGKLSGDLEQLLDHYNIVRDRNNVIRREEYLNEQGRLG